MGRPKATAMTIANSAQGGKARASATRALSAARIASSPPCFDGAMTLGDYSAGYHRGHGARGPIYATADSDNGGAGARLRGAGSCGRGWAYGRCRDVHGRSRVLDKAGVARAALLSESAGG